MSTLLGYSLLMFFVLIIYRKLNNRFQEEKFRFKLHRLRNDLRTLAIENKINVKSEEFDFLDFSISKSIQQSYFITLFYLISLDKKYELAHKSLDEYKNAYSVLLGNINKNSNLSKIESQRNEILKNYIVNQNMITLFIFKNILVFILSIRWIKNKVTLAISSINYLPETSGISQLA